MTPKVHDPALDRRAKLAFGVALICGLFLVETAVAHRSTPHAASVFIWAALGAVAVGALVLGAVWHRRARQPAGADGR
jgi:hypothetical protein